MVIANECLCSLVDNNLTDDDRFALISFDEETYINPQTQTLAPMCNIDTKLLKSAANAGWPKTLIQRPTLLKNTVTTMTRPIASFLVTFIHGTLPRLTVQMEGKAFAHPAGYRARGSTAPSATQLTTHTPPHTTAAHTHTQTHKTTRHI